MCLSSCTWGPQSLCRMWNSNSELFSPTYYNPFKCGYFHTSLTSMHQLFFDIVCSFSQHFSTTSLFYVLEEIKFAMFPYQLYTPWMGMSPTSVHMKALPLMHSCKLTSAVCNSRAFFSEILFSFNLNLKISE
jgi:hypothetical protein